MRRNAHGRQRRGRVGRQPHVVETNDRNVVGDSQTVKIQRQHRAEGHLIVGGEQRGERFAAGEKSLDGRLARWLVEPAFDNEVWKER